MSTVITDKQKLNNSLAATAAAIRAVTGDSAQIAFDYENETGFAAAIPSAPAPVLTELNAENNGVYSPPAGVDGYSTVRVAVAARNPRCDQTVTFDWGDYQQRMGWDGAEPTAYPSFETGTDAEISALLDAAEAGSLDLQNGVGWNVGDKRLIHVNAFTGANSTAHAAEDVYIVITSFDDYNDCGCLLQFDFLNCLSTSQSANTGGSNVNYADSDMYATTLPAMLEALPSWLKNRLKVFSVLAVDGSALDAPIDIVPSSKLALRGLSEIFGDLDAPSEGAQLDYYKTAANCIKTFGSGGAAANWFTRTRDNRFSALEQYAWYDVTSAGQYNGVNPTSAYGLAPFGCLGGIPAPQIPSWTTSSDAAVAAAIDAAQAGTADLQRDYGWRVGDMRLVHVDAWTGGDNVEHPAEDFHLVISQFGNYNGCGSVMQFDFVECCNSQRMLAAAGSYGETEMYSVTLPALVNALPAWLKNRLKTFSVLCAENGNMPATIDTVAGNKLALRAYTEIFGTIAGIPDEGSQAQYYSGTQAKQKVYAANSFPAHWWTRTPYGSGPVSYWQVRNIGESATLDGTYGRGLAPFGCL